MRKKERGACLGRADQAADCPAEHRDRSHCLPFSIVRSEIKSLKKNISYETRCRRSGLDPPTNPAHATDYFLIFYFSYLGISMKNKWLTRCILFIGRMPGGNQWWMKLRSIMGILAQHDSTYEVLHQDNTICFASLRQIFLQLFAKIMSYR